jgi:putative flavoprotein involved in K+ transport
MVEKIESVMIGGGQAGLSLSHYLTQAGREHIVLEKSPQVADAWRNRRPDSFTLVSPNWTFRLPGAEYADSEPEGFMPKAEIVRRFEQYEQDNHPPVSYSTEVTRVEPIEDHYRYRTFADNMIYESKNVILATGM